MTKQTQPMSMEEYIKKDHTKRPEYNYTNSKDFQDWMKIMFWTQLIQTASIILLIIAIGKII